MSYCSVFSMDTSDPTTLECIVFYILLVKHFFIYFLFFYMIWSLWVLTFLLFFIITTDKMFYQK